MKILEKVHTDGINDVNALVYAPTIPKTDKG